MLDSEVEFDESAITVPYEPFSDDLRNNRGFVDLRGRPELAAEIAEGSGSPALKRLLMQLAQPDSKLFSVGCDLGTRDNVEGYLQHAAGGYIQVMHKNYAPLSPDAYLRYAEAMEEALMEAAAGYDWFTSLVATFVQFDLDDYREITGSLVIHFDAGSTTPPDALQSREVLIDALATIFSNDDLTLTLYDPDADND
jgi:hypothetical protein